MHKTLTADFFYKTHFNIIIEGCVQDDVNTLRWDTAFVKLPPQTQKINSFGQSLELELISDALHKQSISVIDLEDTVHQINYSTFRGIQCPRTIIVEDGRIYHADSGYERFLGPSLDFIASFASFKKAYEYLKLHH